MVRSDLDIYLYLQHDNMTNVVRMDCETRCLLPFTWWLHDCIDPGDISCSCCSIWSRYAEWSRRLRGSTELHRYLLITILTFVSIPESVDRTGYFMSRFSHVSSTKQHPAVPRAAAAQGLWGVVTIPIVLPRSAHPGLATLVCHDMDICIVP